jgi:hypothetical protein
MDIAVPFVPITDGLSFTQKYTRGKLATLPTSRFEDLFIEFARRYPEFQEEVHPSPFLLIYQQLTVDRTSRQQNAHHDSIMMFLLIFQIPLAHHPFRHSTSFITDIPHPETRE